MSSYCLHASSEGRRLQPFKFSPLCQFWAVAISLIVSSTLVRVGGGGGWIAGEILVWFCQPDYGCRFDRDGAPMYPPSLPLSLAWVKIQYFAGLRGSGALGVVLFMQVPLWAELATG